MKVERLSWKNYRNLSGGELVPCDTINVISGPNAQGKTNLLEALWLFTGGRSFRGAKDGELVRQGEEAAKLSLDFFSEERSQNAVIRIEKGRRSAELNGNKKKSCAALVGKLRSVVFSPEHIELIRGGPALRRNFIDSALCQFKPGYTVLLSRYHHTLFQRNALLKDIPHHSELLDTLDVWDFRLSELGGRVMQERISYLEKLKHPAARFYSGICGRRESMGLKYVKSADNFKEALSNFRRADLQAGFTTIGPHRDDLEITIDSFSTRSYGSQGQKRSAVLALKLAEAELLSLAAEEKPVVLLDDVMSELDSSRQEYLLNHLTGFQVFITCCEPESTRLLKRGRIFQMENGMPRVFEDFECQSGCTPRGAADGTEKPARRNGGDYVPSPGAGHSDQNEKHCRNF